MRAVALAALAAVGATLLAVVIAYYWSEPNDSLAYWLAGMRLAAGDPVYVTGESAFAPYAYHYPPPLAQALAPLTLAVPALVYVAAYRALELGATWHLAGRRLIPMLALVAFIPVAVELRFENVHLLMALGIVLGLTRWPWLFAVGAVVKLSPGLGVVYLLGRRRWRDALFAGAVGVLIVTASAALDWSLWHAWFDSIAGRGDIVGNSLLPIPYTARAAIGTVLAAIGGIVGRRRGELALVAAITIANPGLALNGLAVLAAAVPIWSAGPGGLAESRRPRSLTLSVSGAEPEGNEAATPDPT